MRSNLYTRECVSKPRLVFDTQEISLTSPTGDTTGDLGDVTLSLFWLKLSSLSGTRELWRQKNNFHMTKSRSYQNIKRDIKFILVTKL